MLVHFESDSDNSSCKQPTSALDDAYCSTLIASSLEFQNGCTGGAQLLETFNMVHV
jgi:hypothetical protein